MQPLNTVRQLGYVVTDLDVAVQYWVNTMGAGPFFLIKHCALKNQHLRGRPVDVDVDVDIALGNNGDVQIELIFQRNSEVASVYNESSPSGHVGLHHFGLMPSDYQKARKQYSEQGFAIAFEATVSGAELVYFDTRAAIGHYTELWERSEVFDDVARLVEAAAVGWDGNDAFRPMPT
jgi:hypothetical protein